MKEYQIFLRNLNKENLERKIELTRETEQELIDVYSVAVEDMVEEIKRDRRDGLRKSYIENRIFTLGDEVSSIVKNSIYTAAEEGIKPQYKFLIMLGEEYGVYHDSLKFFSKVPGEALKILVDGGIYKDGKGLDQRIWSHSVATNKSIDKVINAAILKGTSAVKLSRLLEEFIHPTQKKYWNRKKIEEKLGKGYSQPQIEYNSLRLARTSISHAFSLGNRMAAATNPDVKGIRWHSVFAHGRTCEICKERDGKLYTVENLPFDHPNGMCWEEIVYKNSILPE